MGDIPDLEFSSKMRPSSPESDIEKLVLELVEDLKSLVVIFARNNEYQLKEIGRGIDIMHSAVVAFCFEFVRHILSIIDNDEHKRKFIEANREMISTYMRFLDESFKDYI